MCCNKITLLSRSFVTVGGDCSLRYQRALVGDVFEDGWQTEVSYNIYILKHLSSSRDG